MDQKHQLMIASAIRMKKKVISVTNHYIKDANQAILSVLISWNVHIQQCLRFEKLKTEGMQAETHYAWL